VKKTVSKNELEKINIHPNKILRFLRKVNWLFSVYLKPQHDAVLATRNGILAFNSKDKTTGRILSVYRNHEYDEMSDVVDFLKKKKLLSADKVNIVIDVGGYIGMSSTGFLVNDLFSKALSFEPSPENFRLLEKNIHLNALEDKMRAYNIALSDEKGSLEFELSEKNYGDNRVRESTSEGMYGEKNRSVIQIEANTFDAFLEENSDINQNDIKLLWMDIQGHEGRFIKGAKNFIKQHPEVPMAIEFWPYGIERSGMQKDEFLNMLKELYKTFYILGHYDTPHNISEISKYYDENPSGSDGLNILLMN